MPARNHPGEGGRAAVSAALSGTRSQSGRPERGASRVRFSGLPRPLAGVRLAIRLSASLRRSPQPPGRSAALRPRGRLTSVTLPPPGGLRLTPRGHFVCPDGAGWTRGAEVSGFGDKGRGVIVITCGRSGGCKILGALGWGSVSSPSKVLLPRRRPLAVCFTTLRYYAMGAVVPNQPVVPGLRGRRGPRRGLYEG